MTTLQQTIETAWDNRELLNEKNTQDAILEIISLLDEGSLRVAEPIENGWQVNEWVKKAVVMYFPIQTMETIEVGPFEFHDKIPLKKDYKDKGIRCVGCSQIGTYDLLNNKSSLSSDGPINFSEASMAYFKDFWVQKQFTSTQLKGEHKDYMESRLHNCMDIPYAFVIIAFTHNNNYTSYRKIDKNILKFKSTNKITSF